MAVITGICHGIMENINKNRKSRPVPQIYPAETGFFFKTIGKKKKFKLLLKRVIK